MRRLGRKREGRAIALNRSTLETGPEVASASGMHLPAIKKRGRGPGTPFPPTLLFVLGLLFAWWLHASIPFQIVAAASFGPWVVAIGAAALAVGTAVFWWGMSTFARARTGILLQRPASRLVTYGPYRWSRNPMYVGFVAMYLGLALLMNSVWPITLLPAVIVALELIVITREERYLRTIFGSLYDEYCRRVNRWI
jgi:protein-S-isoprenylcysteine O-methyltransferase Ste14